jgi:hypothetical protein
MGQNTTIATAILILTTAVLPAGDVIVDGTYVSTVGTGTPPLEVSSSTHVPNLNADLLDGMSSADLAPADHVHTEYPDYRRTVIVSPYLNSSGDQEPIQSGLVLLAALASITTATEVNPYLLKLEPGIYDLDEISLQMKEWVDIEGSGRSMTTIRSRVTTLGDAVVLGADNAEIRGLTVLNLGGGEYEYTIYNDQVSPRFVDMDIIAYGGTDSNVGIRNEYAPAYFERISVRAQGGDWSYGISSLDSSVVLRDVEVTVQNSSLGHNTGISFIGDGFPIMTDITVTALGGAYNTGIVNSGPDSIMSNMVVIVSGDDVNEGIVDRGSSAVMSDIEIRVAGGEYNTGFFTESASSPLLHNVRILAASGANNNYGIVKQGSSPELKGVTVEALGGTMAYGVLNWYSSQGTLIDVTAKAAGASSYNYAVMNQSGSTLRIVNLTAEGSGGSGGFGVYNSGDGNGLTLDNSDVSGTSNSVRNDNASADVFVGGSKLDGTVSANVSCVASYDGSYSTISCP